MPTLVRSIGLAILCGIAALGCSTTYYDEYRAAHPGFDPTLPRVGVTLPELLAALEAPHPVETIDVVVSEPAIYRVGEEGRDWQSVEYADVRSGAFTASDADDYVVLVGWTCRFERGLAEAPGVERFGFHLLPGNRVVAYDHYDFRERCVPSNHFLAARGPAIALEREAFARLSVLGTRFSLEQAYRRGLAYLEAGRVAEARAMLLLGERSYRASAAKLREAGRTDALAEVDRLRASLMRALGVEPRS
ncbi:MAG: hypothetical protein ACQGVC_22665 [Myxococcota bacterium]